MISNHSTDESMAENDGRKSWGMLTRPPVLTLWAAMVGEVLGFEHNEALISGGRWEGLTLT